MHHWSEMGTIKLFWCRENSVRYLVHAVSGISELDIVQNPLQNQYMFSLFIIGQAMMSRKSWKIKIYINVYVMLVVIFIMMKPSSLIRWGQETHICVN